MNLSMTSRVSSASTSVKQTPTMPLFQGKPKQPAIAKPTTDRLIPPGLDGFISSEEKETIFREFYNLYQPLVKALYQNVSNDRPFPKNLSISWPSAMYWASGVKEPFINISYEDKPQFLKQVQILLKQLENKGVFQKAGTVNQTNGKGNIQTAYEYNGLKICLTPVVLL
jgi:hypothetical protein